MAKRPRQRVGRSYRQTFQLTESAGPAEVSRSLEEAWSSEGDGQGGDALDDLLDGLGEAYVEEGHVKWFPPPGLDAGFREYLSRSVAELNKRLEAGELVVDDDGNIRPPDGR